MQIIKPVANAELSNSDNRALEHPSWRLNLSGFQQLRGAGDRRQLAQKGKEAGQILDGDRKENASRSGQCSFLILSVAWKSTGKCPIIWGEDSVSACFLSFAYLLSYRLGFNFMFWPIPPACLWVSFHSHSMTDPVLHVNALQNSRGVLHLVGKKDQASPLCSPFLAPAHSIHTQVAPFLCWAQCQVLRVDRYGLSLHGAYS